MKLFSLMTAAVALAAMTGTAAAADKLTIWINGDKAFNGLAEVGKKFEKDTGVAVVVEHPENPEQKYAHAASTGSGPDILFWAHDRLGEFAAAGLVVPVTPGAAVKADVLPMAWDAFTYKGKVWGYPIALEAIGLVYNKALVPTPPKAFEDIPALAETLKAKNAKAIMWAYNTPYFAWPLMAAGGAAAFEKAADGGFDVKKTGANSESAVKGADVILSLIEKGVMPKGVTYPVAEAAINKGESAMFITGPWAWENLRRSKIDFGVAPLPTVAGKPAVAYVGVLGGMINAQSKNKDIAVEFLENYLMKAGGLRTMDKDVAIGVPASKAYYEELKGNPNIAATMANVQAGTPMPNIPEMAKFWAAMEAALGNITGGRQPAKEALEAAAGRIVN
jgi:maltose/maltodextrin transport system substrate-binding protein